MSFLRQLQPDLMLFLGGICASITCMGLFMQSSKLRKLAMFMMSAGATVSLVGDAYAYIYRGDPSELGFWMVRVSNFLVFFMPLVIIHGYNLYLTDLLKDGSHVPLRLRIAEAAIFAGEVLVVIAQFTGLFYTFDASNTYQRADGFLLSYIIPVATWIVQFSAVVQYRKKVSRPLFMSTILFTVLPIAASVLQVIVYGISFTNFTIALLAVNLRINDVKTTNDKMRRAQERETELLLAEQENLQTMMEETALALAEAIDAKDCYTHGHSARVADYSVMIAKQFGYDEAACSNLFLVGLLHDVGKIGIPEEIINKKSRLTDEEYAIIKTHSTIGNQILQRISKNPMLSIGAHYHHERYDGTGYPEGLKGEDIPEIARIIAVADAYDAMTSNRSYRNALPQDVVRSEIVRGKGTQFDPAFAEIMLGLMDQDTEYSMREK